MGGGGSFYDRDTSDGYVRSRAGFSAEAAKQLNANRCDPGLLPKGRRIACGARSPVWFGFDVTGSMGNLPRIIYDKMPLIAGQIAQCGYLDDAQICLSAIGDITCDNGPVQVCEFSEIRKLDDWLRRIWLEGGGGPGGEESYEYNAYCAARQVDLTDAVTPFFLTTGDEDFRRTLYKADLERIFGGTHADIETTAVYAELKKKFNGNVFHLFPTHGRGANAYKRWIANWQELVGKERVVVLDSDEAVADVMLGIFAVGTGARTLDEYCDDLKTKRAVAQTDERVDEVRKALSLMATLPRNRPTPPAKDNLGGAGRGVGGKKTKGGKKSGKGKTSGRI